MDDRMEQCFWGRTAQTAAGCWEWTGARDRYGYGHLSDPRGFGNGRAPIISAHRLAWEVTHGPIPVGLQIDHLCRNRACVNPDHMDPVTARENTLRGAAPSAANAKKQHCDTGHELNEANVYRHRGRRLCRACNRQAVAKYRQRKATA